MLPSDEEILRVFSELDPGSLPIGVYMVRPDGEFLFASPAVRRLLMLSGDKSLRGISLTDYYHNISDRIALLEKADEASRQGHYLDGEILHLRVNGSDVFAEDFCKPLYHPDRDEVIGYYGCLIDRTGDLKNRRRAETLGDKVEELTIDIGRVLHANNTTLLMVTNALRPALDLLLFEHGLMNQGPRDMLDQSASLLQKASANLVRAIQRVFDGTEEPRRLKALPALRWEYLEQVIPDLKDYRQNYQVEDAHPSVLRLLARDVVEISSEIKTGYLPKELIRELQRAALDLQRIGTMIPVKRAYDAVVQMDYSIQALREFVTTDMRTEERTVKLQVSSVLDHAIASLSEFAKNQNVEVAKKEFCRQAVVTGVERDLQRACANLLHNAIKYSWSRKHGGKTPWVTIEIHCTVDQVNISFENWGVPVSRDEIEQGLVFDLGYRGKHSKDRSRLGTGVGLTDSRRVARQHGGDILIESRPATSHPIDENARDYYSHPFITTVTLTLPRA